MFKSKYILINIYYMTEIKISSIFQQTNFILTKIYLRYSYLLSFNSDLVTIKSKGSKQWVLLLNSYSNLNISCFVYFISFIYKTIYPISIGCNFPDSYKFLTSDPPPTQLPLINTWGTLKNINYEYSNQI